MKHNPSDRKWEAHREELEQNLIEACQDLINYTESDSFKFAIEGGSYPRLFIVCGEAAKIRELIAAESSQDNELKIHAPQKMVALRDHPQMTYWGQPNWPPVWIHTRITKGIPKLIGEVGVLEGVDWSQDKPTRIFLRIGVLEAFYVGTLNFNDPGFCKYLYSILRCYVGYSIKEIGALDVGLTF